MSKEEFQKKENMIFINMIETINEEFHQKGDKYITLMIIDHEERNCQPMINVSLSYLKQKFNCPEFNYNEFVIKGFNICKTEEV